MTAEQILLSNQKQQAKLSWKRRQMCDMANQIKEYLESFGAQLPNFPVDWDKNIRVQFQDLGYDDIAFNEWMNEYGELASFYYKIIRTNKAIYANFKAKGKNQLQLLAAWYNKHRFDLVWLWRKSQLVRRIYRNYLTDHAEIRENCHPVHLVLTVPHPNGEFQGKKFYAKELAALYHEMRRMKFWKDSVYGGEYGIEVKKSKENGLHIHIHSLVFLHKAQSFDDRGKDNTVNVFRAKVKECWERITGGCMTHVETLYYYKRNESNQYIKEHAYKKNPETGKYDKLYTTERVKEVMPGGAIKDVTRQVPVMRKKKFYINDKSTQDEYLQGILECIKYHFKSDVAEDQDGGYDIELIKDILNHSKKLRFYSRFGAFYRCSELNMDTKINEIEDEQDSEQITDDVELGSSSQALKSLHNPFTLQPSTGDDFEIVIASPESLNYSGKHAPKPFHLINYEPDKIRRLIANIDLSEAVKALCTGTIWQVLEPVSKTKYANV